MSKRHDIQDGTGIIAHYPPIGSLHQFGFGAPTSSIAGSAKGAIYQDLTNGHWYINSGSNTSSTWVQVDAGTALAGLLATAAEINRSSQVSTRLVDTASATTTLTMTQALHEGKILTIHSTGGLAVTPPPATGSGSVYQFLITTTISGGSFTIDAKAGAAADVFLGRAYQLKVGTGETVYAAGATDNLLTMDGTTRGGIAGDYIHMTDMALNKWSIFVDETASGTVATPFSNH